MPSLPLLLLAACATQGAAPRPGPAADVVPPGPVRLALAPGTVVRLLPATASPEPTAAGPFVDALWREALQQSPRLDIAAGIEDAPSPFAVALHVDRDAATLSSTLVRPGQPPLPLASASGDLPGVIDALALRTRQALGEEVAAMPQPAAASYSADPEAVELTERALVEAQRGERRDALALLRRARQRDPGSPEVLAALAKTLLTLGSAGADARAVEEARRIAVDALQLAQRLSPTTEHELAHIAIAAQAFGSPDPALDRELLRLGEVALRERPQDPHALYTRAVALNLLGRYDESLPALRHLAGRWPHSAEVAYHLAFAELATGDADAALAAIRRAASTLPRQSVVVPMALALFHTGRHDELRRYLADLAADPVYVKSARLHDIRRMQAAHALLTDDADAAVRFMLEDLEWIRQRPSRLESFALDVADTGTVLVRIGHDRDLAVRLEAFEQLGDLPPTFAEVMVYLGGLIQVAARGSRAEAAEAHLRNAGQTVWSSIVKAAAHRRRGELMDELRERVFEYQSTESPLVRADLARALQGAGDADDAARVLDELRARLLAFDLRRPRQHPLMGPENALAYLATRELGR